ncbi:MAG: hypothetical protein AUH30_05360 [Candidatus Rokubacteria bacterium 13_1_40CM_68_15]|nr:MAG: hypothetical protein AUH30_05360 [Candidatus Rokubacteria bacterium 13_1_40CM_68_15]
MSRRPSPAGPAGGNEQVHQLPAARVDQDHVGEPAMREHDGGRLLPKALEIAGAQVLRRRERLQRAESPVDLPVDGCAERLGRLLESVLQQRPLLGVHAEHEPDGESEQRRQRDEDENHEVPS